MATPLYAIPGTAAPAREPAAPASSTPSRETDAAPQEPPLRSELQPQWMF